MNRFVQTLQPTYTLLVHGDDTAREQLSHVLDPKYHPMLVENGECYPFEKRSSGSGVVGKRYKQQVDTSLKEKMGSVVLYQESTDEAYKLAICVNVYGKTNTLICHTMKGKQIKLSLGQITETIGYWNRSIDELQIAANDVMIFSRPYIEKIDWTVLADGSYSLQDIFQALGIQNIQSQITIALALQSLLAAMVKGKKMYTFDDTIKNQLSTLALPIQGKRLNAARAMANF